MRYILDANVAIAALNGVPTVRAHLAKVSGSEVGIPIVAIAELTFGAYKSRQREVDLERISELRQAVAVLGLSDDIVDLYGSTRAVLESRGRLKSDFDLLIACTALSHSATLVTSDRGLLDGQIDGLQAENWLEGTA